MSIVGGVGGGGVVEGAVGTGVVVVVVVGGGGCRSGWSGCSGCGAGNISIVTKVQLFDSLKFMI